MNIWSEIEGEYTENNLIITLIPIHIVYYIMYIIYCIPSVLWSVLNGPIVTCFLYDYILALYVFISLSRCHSLGFREFQYGSIMEIAMHLSV